MTPTNTKNKPERCECGDLVVHPPNAHTDLSVAVATADRAARIARDAATTAAAWMQVVRRLAGDGR